MCNPALSFEHYLLTSFSATAKHFQNDPSSLVIESLQGLCAINPNLRLDANNKVVYLASQDKSKVALICGGGSGHEPSHAGFVGQADTYHPINLTDISSIGHGMLSGNSDPLSGTFSHITICKLPYVVMSSPLLAQHKYGVPLSSLTITRGESLPLRSPPILRTINSTLIIVKCAFNQRPQLVH